jgi:hypothetical protein
MAEEHQRINPFKDLLSIGRETGVVSAPPGRSLVKTTTAAQNKESMNMLQAMMSGVKGKRPRV